MPKEMYFGTMSSKFEDIYSKAIEDRNKTKSSLEYYDKAINLINKINSYIKEFNELHIPVYKKNPDGTKEYEENLVIEAQEIDYIKNIIEDRNETSKIYDKIEEELKCITTLGEWLQNCDILLNLYYCLSKCDAKYVHKTERMVKKYTNACQTSYNTLEKIDNVKKLMYSVDGGIWTAIRLFNESVMSRSGEMIKISRKPKENKIKQIIKDHKNE
jgi:hypothetical protein